MSKFQKLSRAEMKKISGGGERVCDVGRACLIFTGPGGPNHPPTYEIGQCNVMPVSCYCVAGGFIESQEVCYKDSMGPVD